MTDEELQHLRLLGYEAKTKSQEYSKKCFMVSMIVGLALAILGSVFTKDPSVLIFIIVICAMVGTLVGFVRTNSFFEERDEFMKKMYSKKTDS